MERHHPRSLLPKTESGSQSQSPTLESVSTNAEPSTKRRCISSACMPCRKRKSKCDGVRPTCNACLTVYSSQCHYDLDSDHRRKGALKRDIAQLKTELGAQNAILDAIKRGSDADIDDIISLVRANPDETYDSIAENIQKMNLGARQKANGSNSSSGLERELAQLPAKQSLDEKTGDRRHYGHTSNLYFYKTDEENPVNTVEQLDSWTTVTNDTELINHLLDVYFTWSHPFYLFFSEEVFYHGLRDRKLKYCTPLLVNAILALACNFSSHPGTRADSEDPASTGEHFFLEAKRLLYEDDRSSLTTVQALGLMSLRQAMNDNDSPGWQYRGQMMSMAIQLGLHMETVAEPNMTATEIEARRVTFWGVFTVATCWAVCVGRISSLPRAAIRLEKPCLLQHLEDKPWKPHGIPGYDGTRDDLHQPSNKYGFLVQHGLLAEILDDIIHTFYAPRDRITSRRLQQYHRKLQDWYDNLPDSLRIRTDGPTTPQVFTLHVYYHNSLIHLFRPFMKVSFVQNIKPPRQICIENANMISQLMIQYTKLYSMSPSIFVIAHCLMSAGIIHVVTISSPATIVGTAAREQSELYLEQALRCLRPMQTTFPLVERYAISLIGLIYKLVNVVPTRLQEVIAEAEAHAPPGNSPNQPEDPHSIVTSWNPTPPNDQGFAKPSPLVSNHLEQNVHPPSRKHSAPELVQMAPTSVSQSHHLSNPQTHLPSPETSTPGPAPSQYQQQLFWTPFPENAGGVPLPMLDILSNVGNQQNVNNSGTMSVTAMLGGQCPQLSQDGFMLESEHERQKNVGVMGNGTSSSLRPWDEWRG